jgi:hypothetical protein
MIFDGRTKNRFNEDSQLKESVNKDNETITFEYNENELRIKKSSIFGTNKNMVI